MPRSLRNCCIPVLADPRRPANTTRFVYLNTEAAEESFVDYQRIANDAAAMLRLEAGRNPHDKALIELVGELSTRSELFRKRWASHDGQFHRSGRERLRHPIVGHLDLDFESMELSSAPGLQLNVYTAPAGTPTADALKLLASWPASQEDLPRRSCRVAVALVNLITSAPLHAHASGVTSKVRSCHRGVVLRSDWVSRSTLGGAVSRLPNLPMSGSLSGDEQTCCFGQREPIHRRVIPPRMSQVLRGSDRGMRVRSAPCGMTGRFVSRSSTDDESGAGPPGPGAARLAADGELAAVLVGITRAAGLAGERGVGDAPRSVRHDDGLTALGHPG